MCPTCLGPWPPTQARGLGPERTGPRDPAPASRASCFLSYRKGFFSAAAFQRPGGCRGRPVPASPEGPCWDPGCPQGVFLLHLLILQIPIEYVACARHKPQVPGTWLCPGQTGVPVCGSWCPVHSAFCCRCPSVFRRPLPPPPVSPASLPAPFQTSSLKLSAGPGPR